MSSHTYVSRRWLRVCLGVQIRHDATSIAFTSKRNYIENHCKTVEEATKATASTTLLMNQTDCIPFGYTQCQCICALFNTQYTQSQHVCILILNTVPNIIPLYARWRRCRCVVSKIDQMMCVSADADFHHHNITVYL